MMTEFFCSMAIELPLNMFSYESYELLIYHIYIGCLKKGLAFFTQLTKHSEGQQELSFLCKGSAWGDRQEKYWGAKLPILNSFAVLLTKVSSGKVFDQLLMISMTQQDDEEKHTYSVCFGFPQIFVIVLSFQHLLLFAGAEYDSALIALLVIGQ